MLRHVKSHQLICRFSETGETPWWYDLATYRYPEATHHTIQ
jgi:hypothetical protein